MFWALGDKFKQGRPRFALPGTTKESRGEILRESTPGRLRRVAVSLQNCRGSKKRSEKGLDRTVAAGEGLREDVTDGRGGDTVMKRPPPPGLGPQSLTCGARAPWAPPASGTAAAEREKEADNFLLPGAQPGSDSHATSEAARPRLAPSSRPRFAKNRTRDVRVRAGPLARSGEHGFLLPLVFSSSSSLLLGLLQGLSSPALAQPEYLN